MDLDGLRVVILSGRARYTQHSFQRHNERGLDMDAVRASIARGCEIVEDYPSARPNPKALLLSQTIDKRPLHTLWAWDGRTTPELITLYRPDTPEHRHEWTNGYRKRARPAP